MFEVLVLDRSHSRKILKYRNDAMPLRFTSGAQLFESSGESGTGSYEITRPPVAKLFMLATDTLALFEYEIGMHVLVQGSVLPNGGSQIGQKPGEGVDVSSWITAAEETYCATPSAQI